MKKILVIGSGGAGKSTFAMRLHEITGIELIHLDKLYWQPNWVEPSKDEWCGIVKKLSEKDAWIMDGNYSGTMEMRFNACDTIIFLDLPRTICAWRAYKRSVFYKNNTRPGMAEGCQEKFDWGFFKWIWHYPTRTKPGIEEKLRVFENEKTIIRLKSPRETEKFLTKLSAEKGILA